MKNKRHIIIGSIIFIIHFFYNFFAGKWSHFNYYYYIPVIEFLEKAVIIVFIIMLMLKWIKLLVISKRYMYMYIYYVIISYSSGFLGNIIWLVIYMK